MKFYLILSLFCGLALPNWAQAPVAPVNPAQNAQSLSSAQDRIAAAKQQIQAHPERVQGHNELAQAYLRETRETANDVYLKDAEEALKTGLKLEPENFQLLKTQVALLLARHEYAAARDLARKLNRRTPDDVAVYGDIATADIELGDYPDAETAAQWMLNLRPNNVPGLLVGARLRALYGDDEGALDFLNQAYRETSPTETEDLAWIANQIAALRIDSGKLEVADQVLQQVDRMAPNYPYTQTNLARLRMAQGKFAESAKLWQQENSRTPNIALLYPLAKALEGAGEKEQAKAAYAEFERLAKARTDSPAYALDGENSNRELVFFYADQAKNGAEALNLAKREIAVRQDVFTLDAYAWALYLSGQYSDAHTEMEKALAVGVRNAQFAFHSAKINEKLNKSPQNASSFPAKVDVTAPVDARANGLPRPPVFADVAAMKVEAGPDDNSLKLTSRPFQPVPAALLVAGATETDSAIRAAQAKVAAHPKDPSAYARLGAAFFQKARETGDVSNYELAEKALKRSLDLAPDDMSADPALLTLAEVCMGEHRFAEALEYARKSAALGSGDVSAYAIVGDALTDMGEYDQAAAAYMKLERPSDQRVPGSSYALNSRLSYLKLLSGDTKSAIKMMEQAIWASSLAQLPAENRAWLYYELGEYYFQAGEAAQADQAYYAALTIHPGDYRALAGLGRARASQGRYEEAIRLYQKAIAVVPMPLFVAELGDVYAKTGRNADAAKQYQLVEYIGLLGRINQVLHNRDLALFYADHDKHLEQALVLAKKEFEVRHDVYTWDALAWALYKNQKTQEAADAMAHAMSLQTKDAMMMFHAAMIYERLGQEARAKGYFQDALAINPHFHPRYSEMAQQQLAKLDKQIAQAAGKGQSGVH